MSQAEQTALRVREKLRDTRNSAYDTVSFLMRTVIIAELFKRGGDTDKGIFEAEPSELQTSMGQTLRDDFAITITSEKEKYDWSFFFFPQMTEDFKINGITAEKLTRNVIRELSPIFLTDSWKTEEYKGYKISFCFVDEEIFSDFCQAIADAKLNNCFFAILIDIESYHFVEEREFQSEVMYSSIFELPIRRVISFNNDEVTDKVGETNFLLVHEGEGMMKEHDYCD